MSRMFQRRKEDFTCERCGMTVAGDGYTNHCPRCLYSKHVDINPGDRAAACGGLMAPRAIEQKKGGFVIVHVCETCGHTRKNKTSPDDSMETVITVSRGGDRL